MLSDFITQIQSKALARSNRYLVNFAVPGASPDDTRLVHLFCDAAVLPGLDIASSPLRIQGETREMPYERIFSPASMSFYVDAAMTVKNLFDRWMERIVHPIHRNMGYHKDYARDISIKVLGVDELVKYEVILYDAWPKSIGQVQLDAVDRGIMKLPVSFNYKNWTSTYSSSEDISVP